MAELPVIVAVLACPLSMGVMMWAMSRRTRRAAEQPDDGIPPERPGRFGNTPS